MTGVARFSFALVVGASLAMLGCDAGGLLNADDKGNQGEPVKNHSSADIVNGGTVASNGKYKMVYTLGQPSQQQGVAKGANGERLNGGLQGAVGD